MKNVNEIKIGIFAITGLILLVVGWAFLREFSIQQQGYFTVVFDDVGGLTKGSFVRINGLRIGRVDSLTLDTKENKVLVQARIQLPKVTVPNDSKFFIRTSGYVGDKYLDIILGMSKTVLKDGEVTVGEPTIDAFQSLEKISQILNQLDSKAVSMNIQETLSNANSAAKKAAVTSDEVSMALKQRFILPKLLFGRLSSSEKKKNGK